MPIGKFHKIGFDITRQSRRKTIFNKCPIDNVMLANSYCIYVLIKNDEIC